MLIKKYGLQEHVHFTGWRKDSLDIVNLMDMVIHPSLAEGFGRAVLEAMALGKPVIASAVGGLREAVKDGSNGYLVEPGDVSAIAQRWRLLISDPQLRKRVGSAAEQTVFNNYLIDDKAAEMFSIWAEMAQKYE
jgi:glycosyltransferase involved in cell wall biosynthesis